MANRDLVNPDKRDLSTVTVGTENQYPYTYPFDYEVEGLRWQVDPDKRSLQSGQ